MREMTTKVYTADPRQTSSVLETFRRSLNQVRSKSSPELGVVSNFDPDYRGSVTDAMQGYTMLQQQVGVSTVGRLAVHGDYGKVPPGQMQTMRAVPGQPTLIYPVGSGVGSGSLSYIKGGKVEYRRYYQALKLTKNNRTYTFGDAGNQGTNDYDFTSTIITRADATFLNLDLDLSWSENSPLPPGVRYYDLEVRANENFRASFFDPIPAGSDMPAGKNIGMILAANGLTLSAYRAKLVRSSADIDPFTDYDSYLPHDSLGNIRANTVKPTPNDVFYKLTEEFQDDSYWTGEVKDPVNWKDDYWDGLDRDASGGNPRVDRAGMKTWLTAHPKAKFTA